MITSQRAAEELCGMNQGFRQGRMKVVIHVGKALQLKEKMFLLLVCVTKMYLKFLFSKFG